VAQLMKKFPTFYGTRSFITVFTIASYVSLKTFNLMPTLTNETLAIETCS